jgi:type IV pilus assembly protein PilM
MDAAVRFQAQEQVPMPLDQAVLEHQVVGGVPGDDGAKPQVDVVVVAARRETIASFLEPARSAGLEPVGVDLSAFGMIRALAGVAAPAPAAADGPEQPDSAQPGDAVLYCNVGDVMNLAVARGRGCLFTRISATGLEGMTAHLVTDRGLNPEHATQWLTHVGLEADPVQVEGDPEIVADARRVLEEGVTGLIDELRLSLDYYGTQDGAVAVEEIVFCGPGSAVPGLPEALSGELGYAMRVSRPSALGDRDDVEAARLTLSYGLGLDS